MIFKIFAKAELEKLYEILAVNPVIGPISKGSRNDGTPLYDFDAVYDYKDLCLNYRTTTHSLKRFYLPYKQTLCSFSFSPKTWEKHVDLDIRDHPVFFGLHACDINALNRLDKVLSGNIYPDPYYTGKRRNMFIIGLNCLTPLPSCFCHSMDTDTVLQGCDMLLTDLGEEYLLEIHSALAFDILQNLTISDPDESHHQAYMEILQNKNASFTAHVDTTDLTKILDMEFQSEVWKEWGDRCLACGTCANVCPTCYCYGVEENVRLDLTGADKTRQLYSCNLIDFAQVAGGHNFRKDRDVRLKYRYYHKHRGFVEAFEESLCVGCGRCGTACLADITVPEVIASVRGEDD